MAPNMHSPTTPNMHSPTTVNRFFKIILKKTVEDGKIKIPNTFSRKYGGAMKNPVYLNPPDGTVWKVHWSKHDGGIWLEGGWKEFATYYCLDHGYLVTFASNETSHFEVHIFGTSGLEIDYPDDMVEILNEPPPCKDLERRMKSPLISSSMNKELITATSTSAENPEDSQSEETNVDMQVVAVANEDLHGKNNKTEQDCKSSVSPLPATFKALAEAKKFHSKNPYFMVKIKPSHLERSSLPAVPIVFFRECFSSNKQNVKLQFGGKLWPAKLIHYPLRGEAVISAGWVQFAKASNLQAGHVCIFELVNRYDPVLNVHIFCG